MNPNILSSRKRGPEEELVFCTHCQTWQSRRSEQRHWQLEQGSVPRQRQWTSRLDRTAARIPTQQITNASNEPGPSTAHAELPRQPTDNEINNHGGNNGGESDKCLLWSIGARADHF